MTNLRKDIFSDGNLLINFINLTAEDTEVVRKWRNHKKIKKWMYQDHTISSKEHLEFIERLRKDCKNFYWLLKNRKGDYLGIISLIKIDSRNKNAYLGIYSNPNCKLSGSGYLLITSLKHLAFDIFKLHTLKLKVMYINKQAIKFYKKYGFKKEGKLREFVYKNNKWHDVFIMGIVNNRDGNKNKR